MKWRDLLLALALILVAAPFLTAQTVPVAVGGFSGLAPDGTLGAPSYSFAGDPDTGFYRRASGAVGYAFNGAAGPEFNGTAFGATGSGALSSVGFTSAGFLNGAGTASFTLTNAAGTGPSALAITGSARPIAVPPGAMGLATVSTSGIANAGQGARIMVVCGTVAGTVRIIAGAGTGLDYVSLTPNFGAGVIGC